MYIYLNLCLCLSLSLLSFTFMLYLQDRHSKSHQPPLIFLNNYLSLKFFLKMFYPLNLSLPDVNACWSPKVHDPEKIFKIIMHRDKKIQGCFKVITHELFK